MGYRGEPTNPLGTASFLEHFSSSDWDELRKAAQIADSLKTKLPDKDRKLIPGYRTQRKLISVSVDGGSQVLFPFLREVSVGLVRVSAASDDLSEPLEPLIMPIKNYELFPLKEVDGEDKVDRDNRLVEFLEKLFMSCEPLKAFSKATGIAPSDVGSAYKNHEAFTGVIRDLLEWSFIVGLVERFRGVRVLIVRDGRLEQHGMEGAFLDKLRAYFEKQHAYVVGVIKGTKLLREGIPVWVIADWVSQTTMPFFFKVPSELMHYVYRFEKQWDPEFKSTYVFGHRYVTKLFAESFNPLESVITFDIPSYIQDEQEVEDVVATLHACRSVLFGGSLGIVSEAHQMASINSSIIRQIEEEFEAKSGVKLPFRRWGLVG